jgi:hypothetical protein
LSLRAEMSDHSQSDKRKFAGLYQSNVKYD